MADGDDRDENEHNHNHKDGPEDLASFENLEIDQLDESDLEQEYMYLDGQLDQLGACLEQMEARSDSLLSKVKSMIEAQAQEAAEMKKNGTEGSEERPDEEDKERPDTSTCTGNS